MVDAPVPLSFPSVLRNPGLHGRFAHLYDSSASNDAAKKATHIKKRLREQNEGKRWVRRKDNASFVGNPHIVAASKRDYSLPIPMTQSTFPEPLPAYLPRSVKVPTASAPTTDPASANAGRFSVSLKGMRRDLRRAGGRAEALVQDVETVIVEWLTEGGTLLRPDNADDDLQAMGTPVGNTGTISEVSRTPLQLVWRIPEDAFARYIVHCCARYHDVVSFSKGTDENRLTYLLRPNVTRPDRRAPAGIETPPLTDLDYSSNPDTDIDSDFVSERELESDIESDHDTTLSAIVESPGPNSSSLPVVQEDNWSLIDEELAEDFDSGSELGSGLEGSVDILQPRLEALSIAATTISSSVTTSSTHGAPEELSKEKVGDDLDHISTSIRPNPLQSDSPRRREYTSTRSTSSPSRSPVRLRRRRRMGAKKRVVTGLQSNRSFYDFLFR